MQRKYHFTKWRKLKYNIKKPQKEKKKENIKP